MPDVPTGTSGIVNARLHLHLKVLFRKSSLRRSVFLHTVSQIECIFVLDDIRYSFHSTMGAE